MNYRKIHYPPEEEILSNLSLLRDKKDIPVALGARSSCSDHIVTGDKELLEVAGIPSIKTSDLQLMISNKQSKASANYTCKEE